MTGPAPAPVLKIEMSPVSWRRESATEEALAHYVARRKEEIGVAA